MKQVLRALRSERERLTAELGRVEQAIAALNGLQRGSGRRTGRTMSAAARQRIAAAQRARWAKWKKEQKGK